MLEIGPGWGAFAGHALRSGVRFTGITNSEVSQSYLKGKLANFGDQFDIILTDFYDYELQTKIRCHRPHGSLIEHLPDYERVLKKVDHLLKPGGFVFLDGSATRKKYELSTFMVRHIYPGNHSCLVLDDLLHKLARKTELELLEVQNDRRSYSLTFKQWALNLEAHKDAIQRTFGDFEFREFRLFLWGGAYEFSARNRDCYRLSLYKPTLRKLAVRALKAQKSKHRGWMPGAIWHPKMTFAESDDRSRNLDGTQKPRGTKLKFANGSRTWFLHQPATIAFQEKSMLFARLLRPFITVGTCT